MKPIKNEKTETKAQEIANLLKSGKVDEANVEFQNASLEMVRWEAMAFADRINFLKGQVAA